MPEAVIQWGENENVAEVDQVLSDLVDSYELDFVMQYKNEVVPLEVKSGERIRASSLKYYAQKYPDETRLRVRLSLRNFSLNNDVLNVPLYLAGRLTSLLELAEQTLR